MLRCPGKVSDYSTNLPTDPYVRLSLIRFLGALMFPYFKIAADAAIRVTSLCPPPKH